MSKLGLVFTISALAAIAPLGAQSDNHNGQVPVLLELFTSEGCSDCPPADRLLDALDRTQSVDGAEVIVLSEHVDYWNHLGWRDPYSSAQLSARQSAYASKFRLDSVYTPQLVVDGRLQFVGSDGREAKAAIEKERREQKLTIAISHVVRTSDQVTAHIEMPATKNQPDNRALGLYVALADNKVESQVARGENAGRALAHVAVVRYLAQVDTIRGNNPVDKQVTLPIQPGVGTNGVRIVAFLQDAGSGHILGAALHKLQ
jgi:hypothetical protein